MRKINLKKIASIGLTFLMIASTMSINTFAEDYTDVAVEDTKSTMAIASYTIDEVSDSIQEWLLDEGVEFSQDSLVEIIPVTGLNARNSDTAICITTINDENIQRDIFLTYIEDENGNITMDNSLGAEFLAQGDDESWGVAFPPKSWGEGYMIHATATAGIYTNGSTKYYKPYKCQFYYENSSGVTVNSIDVKYIADGFLYSYPGFSNLNLSEYQHVVDVYKSSPVTNTVYSSANYFSSNRVLYMSSGSPMVGQFLTFTSIINGQTRSYTVTLSL